MAFGSILISDPALQWAYHGLSWFALDIHANGIWSGMRSRRTSVGDGYNPFRVGVFLFGVIPG